jgi:hypothetical protein
MRVFHAYPPALHGGDAINKPLVFAMIRVLPQKYQTLVIERMGKRQKYDGS